MKLLFSQLCQGIKKNFKQNIVFVAFVIWNPVGQKYDSFQTY